jgi:hypothetical protein
LFNIFKKILFTSFLLISLFFVAEFISSLFLNYMISHNQLPKKFLEITPTGNKPGQLDFAPDIQTIHPYLGFVANPKYNSISQYGFLGKTEILFNKQKNEINVGVFGGSVARDLASSENNYLQKALRKLPEFSGKKVQIVNLALAGYKQPQQLFTLTYLLALGAHFDLVINVDGFNELVLPVIENLPQGLNPFYPRGWQFMLRRIANYNFHDFSPLNKKIFRLGLLRRRLITIFEKPIIKNSLTFDLLWLLIDRYLENQIIKYQLKLQSAKISQTKNSEITGPSYQVSDETRLHQDLVGTWEKCSALMALLCRANNIRYFHFLQPNQYLPDSKILSAEEKKSAYLSESSGRHLVACGYPLLIKSGRQLIEQGINFYNLSGIFRNTAETVYGDNLCGVNALGERILAQKMAQIIGKNLGQKNFHENY